MLFFSATLDGEAARIAHAYTRDARHRHRATPEQCDVEHRFVRVVADEDKVDALLSRGGRPRRRWRSSDQARADRLANRLGQRGVDAAAIHATAARASATLPLRPSSAGRRPPTWPRAGSTSRTSRT